MLHFVCSQNYGDGKYHDSLQQRTTKRQETIAPNQILVMVTDVVGTSESIDITNGHLSI